METDLEFLDEVASFLETGMLGHALTPRNSLIKHDFEQNSSDAFRSWTSLSRAPLPSLNRVLQGDTSEGNSSSGSENTRRSTKRKTRNEPVDIRRKKYLQRVKDERTGLREMEKNLSTQLREIFEAHAGTKTTPRTDLMLSESFWMDVAIRQRARRLHSEKENKRLATIVNAQAAYMRSLGVNIHESPASSIVTAAGAPNDDGNHDTIDDSRWLRLKSSVPALYNTYLEEMDAAYARVDEAFRDSEMASVPVGVADSSFKYKADGSVEYFQHRSRILVPLNFRDMCSNMWEMSKLPHQQCDREVFENVSDQSNTFAFKFRLKRTLTSGAPVSILKQFLLRQYVEKDRVVIIWKVFAEGEGIFSGMDADEVCWAIIRPVSKTETLMEMHARQIPVPFLTANATDPTVQEFQRILGNAIREDERMLSKTLRKPIFEEALRDISLMVV